MSDHTPSGRRIAARIVPVRRLETTPVARRIGPNAPDGPAPSAPAGRTRMPGARLANGARFYRPALDGSGAVHGDATTGFDDADVPAEMLSSDAGERFTLPENADLDAALLRIWDQAPMPQEDEIDVPRWVSNVELLPDEAEFAALGQYLISMVDGFANFCLAPSVTESGNWQARLQMPPKVLPETMLDMSLSPLHARLRFETQHPVSRALLERHVDDLREQVRGALDATREVEVALW